MIHLDARPNPGPHEDGRGERDERVAWQLERCGCGRAALDETAGPGPCPTPSERRERRPWWTRRRLLVRAALTPEAGGHRGDPARKGHDPLLFRRQSRPVDALVDDHTHDANAGLWSGRNAASPARALHRKPGAGAPGSWNSRIALSRRPSPRRADERLRTLINDLYTGIARSTCGCFGEVTPQMQRNTGAGLAAHAAIDASPFSRPGPRGVRSDPCFEYSKTWLRASLGRLSHEGSAT